VIFVLRMTIRVTLIFLGSAMFNLSRTYFALGRHQDAVVMGEKALEFMQRHCPLNHVSIGATRSPSFI
jgi:hypothetical protein